MRAAVFCGPRCIQVADRPDPAVAAPTDAIVRVVLGCVCGSDLWYYRGESPHALGPIGHEFIGVVEQVGAEVRSIAKGDFIVAPFKFSDGTLVRIPGTGHSDETMRSLLTLSDVMATGHHAAVSAGVKRGSVVAIVGDGAVGLCAVIAARRLNAARIIALSRHAARQALARSFGATDIVAERGDAAIQAILEMTHGVGVAAAVECVGTAQSFATAFAIARPGSTVGFVGVPHGVEVPIDTMFARNIGLRGGSAPVRRYIPELLDDVLEGRIDPGRVFDFETNLDGIAEGYRAMDERRAIKSLLRIGMV